MGEGVLVAGKGEMGMDDDDTLFLGYQRRPLGMILRRLFLLIPRYVSRWGFWFERIYHGVEKRVA